MTRGKYLDKDTQLFIFYFYSNNGPTSPKGPSKQDRFSERRLSKVKNTVTTGWMRKCSVAFCSQNSSENNAQFVSVDLMGEKIKSY